MRAPVLVDGVNLDLISFGMRRATRWIEMLDNQTCGVVWGIGAALREASEVDPLLQPRQTSAERVQ
jgi:hypothetical protein